MAKQREQYCYYQEGKHSFLSEERIDLLNSIGFVWRVKGKGVNNNNPRKIPDSKAHLKVERKVVAKMKEDEKKLVELKSAMSIITSQEGVVQPPTSTTQGLERTESSPQSKPILIRTNPLVTHAAGHGSWLC